MSKMHENARKIPISVFIYHIYHTIYHFTCPINRGL